MLCLCLLAVGDGGEFWFNRASPGERGRGWALATYRIKRSFIL